MSVTSYIFGRKYGADFLTDLYAYYQLNSNANDIVGGFNGISNNMNYSNAGINGNCGTFNGTSSYIDSIDASSFDFSNATNDLPFTISIWLYSASNVGIQRFFQKRGNTATTDQWQLAKSTNVTQFILFTNATNYIGKILTTAPTLNVWEHYVFTYDGSALSSGINIYKNGILTSASVISLGTYTKMPIGLTNPYIGRNSYANNNYWNGKIDELAVWRNRELNATEVAELYNSGVGKFYPF